MPYLRDAAASHAVGALLTKLMLPLRRDVVHIACHHFGIALPQDVRDEIERRAYPGGDYFMNRDSEHRLDDDFRRLELIQTVLVALVAKYIGYSGPIHGYDVAEDGGRVVPEWWPTPPPNPDVIVRYVAEREVTGPHSPAPTIEAPEFALIVRLRAGSAQHFRELKERALGALSPHVISVDPVDIEFASGARDAEFMAVALEQAALSKLEVRENVSPKVGAVVVLDGEVIATSHRGELKLGEHAEYTALHRKLDGLDLSGATIFTTLEPCTKRGEGKLPCVEWIIRRKLSRVVIGTLDPNPDIQGEGVMRLREAGIPVQLTTPSLMGQIEQLNAEFHRQYRPKAAGEQANNALQPTAADGRG